MTRPILAAMLSCQGYELTDNEKRLFEKSNPLGISLFTRNIASQEQLKKLISSVKNVINRDDVLIAIDEEGGRVSRLSHITNKYASEEVLGILPTKYSKYHAILISQELRDLGININYAPVVDIDYGLKKYVLEGRCFSQDLNKIVNRAKAMADTYIEQGICPCIKHIPGHFGVEVDPHLAICETNISVEKIKSEIEYQKKFKNYPLAMVSHVILKAIDSINPTPTSRKVISEIVRTYLGYKNFLISDAVDMRAIKDNYDKLTKKVLAAGVDAICYCSGKYDDLEVICGTKCFMSEKALERFANIKKIFNNKAQIMDMDIRGCYEKKLGTKLNIKYSYDATEVLNNMH